MTAAETTTCTRCGADVPSILSGPPNERDTWRRNQIRMSRREVRHVLRFRMFLLRWLPEDPQDRVRETYTTLDLCDPCAGDVFLFAQGKQPRPNPPVGRSWDPSSGSLDTFPRRQS